MFVSSNTLRISAELHVMCYVFSNNNIVAYLLKARIVEAEKQPLLGNARTHL
jgi:hypothetical protein